jgi:hypothetical protein
VQEVAKNKLWCTRNKLNNSPTYAFRQKNIIDDTHLILDYKRASWIFKLQSLLRYKN